MDLESLRTFCLNLPNSTEDTPFDEDTLVFRVFGKIFALTSINQCESVNLKCDPERAINLRENYFAVEPGYHMNKKHWNTVFFDRDMNDKEIIELIKHSFDLVYSSLPKKLRISHK